MVHRATDQKEQMKMELDRQYGVFYPAPIQGGNEPVTRQLGIPPGQQVGIDPTPPQAIIQGDPSVTVTRQVGSGAQRFGLDGTLYADAKADDGTTYADFAVIAVGEPNPPAPLIPSPDQSMPPRPAFDAPNVTPSDGGSNDPRDASIAPQVFSADKLPVIKKAQVVPVVISASGTVRVARVKKAGR